MSCLYDMSELDVPFKRVTFENPGLPPCKRTFYTLRVCKRCRSEWMGAVRCWFHAPPLGEDGDAGDPQDGSEVGSGIFVRELGVSREITLEEWERRQEEQSTREADS